MVNTTKYGTSAGEQDGWGHKLYNDSVRAGEDRREATKQNLERHEAAQYSNKLFKYLVGASVVIGVIMGLALAPIPTLGVIGGAVGLGLVAVGVAATVHYFRRHNSGEKELNNPERAVNRNPEKENMKPEVNFIRNGGWYRSNQDSKYRS